MSSELSDSFSSLTMAEEQSEANLKPCCRAQNPKTEKQEQEQQKVSFTFPPGYRFCPRDDELIVHYLKKKVMNEPLPYHNIVEVNLSQYSPQQLSETYAMVGENEWYFFTPRDRKYRNGTRPNRAAGIGYWKATGADKPIKHKSVTVGFRKALVFYEGKPQKGEKTNWIMHEYRVNGSCVARKDENDMRLDNWVLCRIYQKMDKSLKSAQRELNSPLIKNYHVGKNCDYEETNDSIGSVSAHKDNIHHTSVDSSVTLVDSYIEGFSKLPADDPYPFHDETKPTYFHMAQPSSTWINYVPDYMNDVQWDASGYQENCYNLLPLEYLNVNPPDSFLDM